MIRRIFDGEWIASGSKRKERLSSSEDVFMDLRRILENPILRLTGARYSENIFLKSGVTGERWHLSWMEKVLAENGKKKQIRNVNPDVMPYNIPGNEDLPALRRYYRLPMKKNPGKTVTRQMTTCEKYEAIWQACGMLAKLGFMKRGKKLVDFNVVITMPESGKRWLPLLSSKEEAALERANPTVRERRRRGLPNMTRMWLDVVPRTKMGEDSEIPWRKLLVSKEEKEKCKQRTFHPDGRIKRLWEG